MLLQLFFPLSLLSLASAGQYCTPKNGQTVRNRFQNSNLLRDLQIPAPMSWLDVRFYTGVSTCLGNLIPVEFTMVEPSLNWKEISGSNSGASSSGSSSQSSSGQSRPGQSSSGQSSSGQSRPGQSRPGQSSPGQSKPGQSRPGKSSSGSSGSDINEIFDIDELGPIGRNLANENNQSEPIVVSDASTTNRDIKMGRNYYTVLFLDPDCDFVDGSGIRWVRTNVPFDKPNFSGDVVFPYFPQLAQTPTGAFGGDKTGGFIHRCVFLVYRQRGHVDPHVVHNYFKRHPTDFFVGKLVRMVNLEPVATAGNFFYGSFNPVPMLVSEEKKELLS